MEAVGHLADAFDQAIDGTRGLVAQEHFELREGHLDGVHINILLARYRRFWGAPSVRTTMADTINETIRNANVAAKFPLDAPTK